MIHLTKQDVRGAFINRKGKRNRLLYEYYKNLFSLGISAALMAEKISSDLGIHISTSIIYKIRHRIQKKEMLSSGDIPYGHPRQPSLPPAYDSWGGNAQFSLQGTDRQDYCALPEGKKRTEAQAATDKFKNAEEYQNKDALDRAFEDL